MAQDMERLLPLVDGGDISREKVIEACHAAACRNLEPEWVLRHEYHIPRRRILQALADTFRCQWVEYDERLPVPAELLAGLDVDVLCAGQWFPLIKDGDTVIIAATDPRDSRMHEEVRKYVPAASYSFRVALGEDVRHFIQDFVNSVPEHIIGNERTGLAHWRNTMARWRTMLACYRTDFARARTHLGLLRGGLGLITIGRALLQLGENVSLNPLYWLMIVIGLCIVVRGILAYFMAKHSILRPPRHQTLVEVTASTLYFLEGYQFAELRPADIQIKKTMLARLNDSIPNFCVFIEPSLDNKVRSSLAHERTSLAGHRTIAACYRTIYARARTGLSFIRTGVAFMTIGLGLIEYFGLSIMTMLDTLLVVAGLLMAVDGAIWYWPARMEAGEAEKSAPLL